ncbi:mitotic checkpoint regulator, MAD2B-interacting-domain-containing protein [Lasiosphaeria hispida]|uniref:Mitotic checkpoint regulator, MAD2B-interacting-domain-containing protein n=1 Tax=Lasiosphaeria hispida TaxID=260671 RepID=A0AAJ0MG59_9PEZI|nr:mitotic checkpoint regulator, MAD2B-interacting-domain-containing protein [Lasiosphaeria hispida]
MGLVDYSDSDSESEPVQQQQQQQQPPKTQPPPSSASGTKKPFQKLINRSAPGAGPNKIVVHLPTTSTAEIDAEGSEPPAKRAKTAAAGSRFSAFGSFLPAPKKNNATLAAGKPAAGGGLRTGGAPAPGVHLKTGAEPAFQRRAAEDDGYENDGDAGSGFASGGLGLPAPKKAHPGPTIPEGQKPEAEVKLVGKPLMFKPLSVSRKPVKKKAPGAGVKKGGDASPAPVPATGLAAAVAAAAVPPPPKKVSLFSMDDDDNITRATADQKEPSGAYEPLFNTTPPTADDNDNTLPNDEKEFTSPYETYAPPPPTPVATNAQSLHTMADDLNLSSKARRELFGRDNGTNADFAIPAGARVLNFSMEQEYEHNEALRTAGAGQDAVYNPVRSIAPGKHSLRQVVNMVQSNQSALEDSFARGRNNRSDAAGRYGWK